MEILVVICFNKLSLKRQQFWMEWILFFSCLTVVRYTEMILKEDLLHSQIHDIKIQTDNTEHYRFPSFRKWKRMNRVYRTHHLLIISSRSNAFVWMLFPLLHSTWIPNQFFNECSTWKHVSMLKTTNVCTSKMLVTMDTSDMSRWKIWFLSPFECPQKLIEILSFIRIKKISSKKSKTLN